MCSKFGNLSLFGQPPSLSDPYLPSLVLSSFRCSSFSPGFHASCCSARLASTCLPGKDFARFLLQPEQKLKDTMGKWSSVAPSSSRRHHPGLGVLLVLTEDPELFAGLALSLSPLPLDLCASSVRAFQSGVCLLLGICIRVLGHLLVLWEI